MNYFDDNLECLKQHRTRLYEKLKQEVNNNVVDLKSLPAKDGDLFLSVIKEEKEYRLNSSYSPKHEAEIWCEQFEFNNMNIVFTMYGLGNGVFVREVLNKKGESDTVIIYEPSLELFLHVIKHYDITDLIKDPNLIIIIEEVNDMDFYNLLRNVVNITNISSQIQCVHPFYDDLFPESCMKFWKEIKDNYFHSITNINTEIVFGKRYIQNSLFNTRFLKDSYIWQDLKDEFNTEIPAIIVAAGPSLKNQIKYLKQAKGRAYIFVVDRILDYVLNEGVEPDYIATVDPIKPIEYFTQRTDVQIPLLCIPVANWQVLDCHKGKKIIYCCSPYYFNLYKDLDKQPPLLDTGASVATAVFSACLQMGFKKVVLVGQDLAYDGEETHAFGAAEKVLLDREIFVEGIDGNKVRSRHDWYEFLNWFINMIKQHPEIEVIDVKEKGAKIEGTTNMSFQAVLDQFCGTTIDKTNVIEGKQGTFSENEMQQVENFLEKSVDALSLTQKKAKEAIKICEEQIRDYSRYNSETAATRKRYKQISKINKLIEEQPVYELLESYITALSAEHISKLYQFSDDVQMDTVSTYQKALKIFEAIIEAVEFTKPLLKDSIENL